MAKNITHIEGLVFRDFLYKYTIYTLENNACLYENSEMTFCVN